MNHAAWRAFMGGGNWSNGAYCGARCLNSNANPWNANGNVGFRGVCDRRFKRGQRQYRRHLEPRRGSARPTWTRNSGPKNKKRWRRASSHRRKPGAAALTMTVGHKHKKLIERIVDWDNLIAAHRLARRGKRNREEVIRFESNLWEELGRIQMELAWNTYRPGRYRFFIVREPKRREIAALPYRDRVVQHAVCNICAPIWDAAMIEDTYACRQGKGTHAAANRCQHWLRDMHKHDQRVWILKMDVSRYFPSIGHRLAKQVIRRKISCLATLGLLDSIIDSTADPAVPDPVGIPVGNLTSQWIANLVGNEIDQWAKRELRLKRYVRYMDDMVVFCWSKREALDIRARFAERLSAMGMIFSKTSILPATRGLNFVGYRIWHDHRLLRRQSIIAMRRRMRTLLTLFGSGSVGLGLVRATVSSWVAHAAHADSWRLRSRLLGGCVFKRDELPQDARGTDVSIQR